MAVELPNYQYAVPENALTRQLEACVFQLRQERDRAVNNWLERCFRDFCPEAAELVDRGFKQDAGCLAESEGFNLYSPDADLLEFRQHDRVLSRLRVEMRFGKVNYGNRPT